MSDPTHPSQTHTSPAGIDPSDVFRTVLAPQWPVRMGNGTFGLLMCVAVFGDALQALFLFFNAIPVVGTLIATAVPFMITTFALAIILPVFAVCGIQVLSGKKAVNNGAVLIGSLVLEATPFLATLPMLSALTIRLFLSSRIEDAERAQKKEARMKQDAQAIDARFASRQREQEYTAQAMAFARGEEDVAQEEMMQGEVGPAPNTLVIPKKKLPVDAYPTTLPLPKAEPSQNRQRETPWHG